jgi:hypothetical protein
MGEQEVVQIQMQQMQQMGQGIGMGMIIGYIVVYLFCVYCLARLATKFGMPMGKAFIWALIPIVNVFLILKLSAKPMWWFILMLIPIVNIVISILVWMSIAERLGKPGWWGVMIGIVPFANIIFFLMLVFGETKPVAATA